MRDVEGLVVEHDLGTGEETLEIGLDAIADRLQEHFARGLFLLREGLVKESECLSLVAQPFFLCFGTPQFARGHLEFGRDILLSEGPQLDLQIPNFLA